MALPGQATPPPATPPPATPASVTPASGAPVFVRMAAHPLRWRLLTELAGGDYRVRELTERVAQPQNLISYHLRLLRDSGLVAARRSSFDARDSYYHLDLERCAAALTATGAALHPALRLGPPAPSAVPSGRHRRVRVLFACTGNSARSPIAEALLRHRGRAAGRVEVISAGSHPRARIHPHAVRVLREEFGLDIADRQPRHLNTLTGQRFDYVITLCDKVREVCPDFGAGARPVHWSIPDPTAAPRRADRAGPADHADPAERTDPADRDGYAAVSRVAAEIDTRIRHLLPVLAPTTRTEV